MPISDAIQALQGAFPADHIAVQGTEQYSQLNKSYLSLLQSDLQPAAIFLPKDKSQVSKFIQLFKPFVLDGSSQFAIRGAGQQPVPGCSNIAGNGVTVDLRYLVGIELRGNTVSVGAGERWGAVYTKLAEHGLGVTGSRSALGGIGGLALSGGSYYIQNCLLHIKFLIVS